MKRQVLEGGKKGGLTPDDTSSKHSMWDSEPQTGAAASHWPPGRRGGRGRAHVFFKVRL